MLAPAGEGQFGENITMASWRTAMKKLGFADFVEVGLGGDMTLFWLVIILVYYFIATFISIDAVIGKIYPIFGIRKNYRFLKMPIMH